MSSNQSPNMSKNQPTSSATTEAKAATKATTRAAAPTPPITRNDSRSPRISPKTQPSHFTQSETTRPGGAFGKYTFTADVMGWASMGKLKQNIDPARSRGASVLPEPETDERMKELANGLKGGVKANAKVEVIRK